MWNFIQATLKSGKWGKPGQVNQLKIELDTLMFGIQSAVATITTIVAMTMKICIQHLKKCSMARVYPRLKLTKDRSLRKRSSPIAVWTGDLKEPIRSTRRHQTLTTLSTKQRA